MEEPCTTFALGGTLVIQSTEKEERDVAKAADVIPMGMGAEIDLPDLALRQPPRLVGGVEEKVSKVEPFPPDNR
ncbi:hypothetical protein Tco_0612817 [Tanacetum coccineum]